MSNDRTMDISLKVTDLPDTFAMTDQAANIIEHEIPEWLTLFLRKNHQYRHLAEATLGDKAMFVDVWRKVNALKLVLWDGMEEAGTEPTDEVILDLIGHLFLMLEYRHRDMQSEIDSVLPRVKPSDVMRAKQPAFADA